MSSSAVLIKTLREGLAELGSPDKASEMRRYMKSAMPYRGVPKPVRARLARRVFAACPLPDRATFVATLTDLWRNAEFREERYLAIDLSGYRRYVQWQNTELIPIYREMIVTGAWWDYVDEIAIRRIGPLLRAEPGAVEPILREWMTNADLWLRRSAIICQVGAKSETNTELLTDAIESTVDDQNFFARKAIGWALRDFSKTNPDWVRRFVAAHRRLSPLSQREALRRLPGA